MKILITGAKGMLGRTLLRRFASAADLQLAGIDLDEGNLADPEVALRLVRAHQPDAIIHCAAFTKVDDCETSRDLAYQANAVGSGNIAAAAFRTGARLIAISTDYVFAGDKGPYTEFDAPAPRTVYGASKLAGEEMIRRHCPRHVIARIAWLYGAGGPSFVHTMMKLGAQDGAALKVVNDQRGNPTSCDAVADGLLHLLRSEAVGTVHLTCEGEATWYEFTREIFRLRGLRREVVACATAEYPRPAPRPADSRLDKMALRLNNLCQMPDWRTALEEFFRLYPQG